LPDLRVTQLTNQLINQFTKHKEILNIVPAIGINLKQ